MLCLYCRSRKGGCRHCNPNHPDYAHNHHDHKQEEVDQLRAENAAEKWAAKKVTAPILTFTISHPGEPAAGLPHYSDTLTVEVESGNPGGEEGAFAEYMAQCLREWYDGAKVDRREG